MTALSNDERAEELMAELFAEDLDRNATGNDLRKLNYWQSCAGNAVDLDLFPDIK